MDIQNQMAAQADVRRYIRRYERRPVEYEEVAYAQEMANQAVVLDRINYSGLNHHAAWVPMAIETAVVIVQKRVR